MTVSNQLKTYLNRMKDEDYFVCILILHTTLLKNMKKYTKSQWAKRRLTSQENFILLHTSTKPNDHIDE